YNKMLEIFKNDPSAKKYIEVPFRPPAYLRGKQKIVKRASYVDTIKVLVLRVEFQKDTTTMTTGDGTFADTAYGKPFIVDSTTGDSSRNLAYDPPHDSFYFSNQMLALRNYYLSDFDGQLFIEWDQYPKTRFGGYKLPHKMAYYGDLYDVAGGLFKLMDDAVREADRDTSANIQFGQYDSYIIFHAGSAWQSDLGDSPNDIPAVYISNSEVIGAPGRNERYSTKDGVTVNDAIIYPETARQDGDTLSGLQGGLAHEFGHQLGMVDLYDVSNRTMGCGGWALMGTGNWNVNGLIPPHHMAWHSAMPLYVHPHTNPNYRRVFVNPVLLDHDTSGVKILRRGENDNDSIPKIYKIPINAHEYYLIADRIAYISPDTISSNPDSNGLRVWKDGVLVKLNDYDQGLPPDYGRGGLAIWHIDDNVIDSTIDYNEVNAGPVHGVKMVEADGIQDFQLPLSHVTNGEAAFYGSPYDLYFSGNNDSLTRNSFPKSLDNEDGYSRVDIKNVSVDRSIMTFDVRFNWRQKGFPIDIDTVVDVNSPVVYDINGDGVNEILQNTVSGGIYIFEPDGTPYSGANNGLAAKMSSNEAYTGDAIGDINGDGKKNIVTTSTDGKIYAYYADSFNLAHYLVKVHGFPFSTGEMILNAPLLADIDGDSTDEIIFGSNDNYLYCLGYNGNAPSVRWKVYMTQWVWGTPIYYEGYVYALSGDGRLFKIDASTGDTVWTRGNASIWQTTTSPVMANLTSNDTMDIFYTNDDGEMLLYDQYGNLKWKKTISDTATYTTFYSSPAVADINGDGKPEIVFTAGGKLFAIYPNGTFLSGFPVQIDTTTIQSSITIGDVDGDDTMDIVLASPGGKLHAINYRGKDVVNFPMSLGDSCYSTPVLADIDGDRDMEILTGDEGKQLIVFDLSVLYDSNRVASPFQHKNVEHNAVYKFNLSDEQVGDNVPIVKENSFYLYPNPVVLNNFKIRFTLNHPAKVTYRIFDASKNVRINKTLNIDETGFPFEIPVDVSALGNDLYIVQIETGYNGKTEKYYKKLLIAK
ncbi:VCBS repeat-containing protein, partial [candidate division WOR-3 bacterium]|nr:VCBS repeat-containing protein [candidate division WOR-3 bacterium]